MPRPGDEILLEWAQYGQALDVRAVDGYDGLEVAFTAPASTSEADIKRLARAKLAYVRRKRSADAQGGGHHPKRGPGVIV